MRHITLPAGFFARCKKCGSEFKTTKPIGGTIENEASPEAWASELFASPCCKNRAQHRFSLTDNITVYQAEGEFSGALLNRSTTQVIWEIRPCLNQAHFDNTARWAYHWIPLWSFLTKENL